MDDEYSAFLDLHNSFGFPQDAIFLSLNPSNNACHLADTSTLGEAVPDFISDHGTPNSPFSSLVTPTDPPSGAFVVPPLYPYPTPFPSEGWPPSHPNSTCMPSHHTPPQPHLPTWQSNANRSPVPSWGAVASPAFDGFEPLHESSAPRAETTNGEGNKKTVNGGNTTTTGPKRKKRSPKRHAPYTVDKDSEGAMNSNIMSQQAFLSERPGYGNDKAQKCTTKRSKKKKSHQSPAAPAQRIAGPSVDRSVVADSPTTTSVEAPRDAPPELTCIRAIRKHARSNRGDQSKVNCAFVNASSTHFELQEQGQKKQ